MSDAPQLEAATAASVHLALTNLLTPDLVDATLDRLCAVLITQNYYIPHDLRLLVLRALQPHLASAASGAPSDQLAVKHSSQHSHRRLRALALAAQCLAFSGGRDAEYRAHWQPAIATARAVLAQTQASAADGTGCGAAAITKNSSKKDGSSFCDGGDGAIAVEEQRFLAHLTLASFLYHHRQSGVSMIEFETLNQTPDRCGRVNALALSVRHFSGSGHHQLFSSTSRIAMLLIVIGAAAYAMTLIQQADRFPLTLGIVLAFGLCIDAFLSSPADEDRHAMLMFCPSLHISMAALDGSIMSAASAVRAAAIAAVPRIAIERVRATILDETSSESDVDEEAELDSGDDESGDDDGDIASTDASEAEGSTHESDEGDGDDAESDGEIASLQESKAVKALPAQSKSKANSTALHAPRAQPPHKSQSQSQPITRTDSKAQSRAKPAPSKPDSAAPHMSKSLRTSASTVSLIPIGGNGDGDANGGRDSEDEGFVTVAKPKRAAKAAAAVALPVAAVVAPSIPIKAATQTPSVTAASSFSATSSALSLSSNTSLSTTPIPRSTAVESSSSHSVTPSVSVPRAAASSATAASSSAAAKPRAAPAHSLAPVPVKPAAPPRKWNTISQPPSSFAQAASSEFPALGSGK